MWEPDRSEVLRSGLCRARHRSNKEDDSDLQRTRLERSFQARQLSFSANLAPKTIGLKDITLKALSSSILSSMSSVKRLGAEGVRVQIRKPHAPPPDRDHRES
ncbi:hypothetical protein FCV25MIE_04782 [Fagus crenata]